MEYYHGRHFFSHFVPQFVCMIQRQKCYNCHVYSKIIRKPIRFQEKNQLNISVVTSIKVHYYIFFCSIQKNLIKKQKFSFQNTRYLEIEEKIDIITESCISSSWALVLYTVILKKLSWVGTEQTTQYLHFGCVHLLWRHFCWYSMIK